MLKKSYTNYINLLLQVVRLYINVYSIYSKQQIYGLNKIKLYAIYAKEQSWI